MKQFLFFILLITLPGAPSKTLAQVDRYGGWLSVEKEAKGFFYLTFVNRRHTLVTPDGHAYYPLGINHMSAYNKSIFSGIQAFQNRESAVQKLKSDLQVLNMNCGGGDSPPILESEMPFYKTISLTNNAHWLPASRFGFTDVFAPAFMEELKEKIRVEAHRYKNNKFLIGYYFTDTPRWDVVISRKRHLKDWVSYLRNLSKEAAGKQRYIAFLQDKYQTIEAFNEAYRLNFKSFEAMLDGRFDHLDFHQPYIISDDTEFLGVIADHLYELATETLRSIDPNHLILGEKYLAGDHPEPVLTAAAKYFDAIAIQPGPEKGPGPGPGQEERFFNADQFGNIHKLTSKPLIICDHSVSFYTDEHPVTLWHQFETQERAGQALARYINATARTPYIVSYSHCQYLDTYDPNRGLLKQGLLNDQGEFHQPYCELISTANAEALKFVEKELNE